MTQPRMEALFCLYRVGREIRSQRGYFFGGAGVPHLVEHSSCLRRQISEGGVRRGLLRNHGFSKVSWLWSQVYIRIECPLSNDNHADLALPDRPWLSCPQRGSLEHRLAHSRV